MALSRVDYGRGARFYDALAAAYSLGAIARAKREHLRTLRSEGVLSGGMLPGGVLAGKRLLYAGAGGGAEALLAAAGGAEVTLVDTSAQMLAVARRRFDRARAQGTFAQGRLEDFVLDRHEQFDAVLAHFFLNVFASHEIEAALHSMTTPLAPGGRLWIADFHGPTGQTFLDAVRRLYYLPPLALFGVLAKNPWHELYDYPARVDRARLPLRLVERIPVRLVGLPLYEALCFVKEAAR